MNCGGRPGVSDSFATALWAPDTLFALLRARADGVNVHVRADTINAPFALSAHGLLARPLLYGLIMFTRALRGATQLMAVRVSAAPWLHLRAWAVRTRNGSLRILLIDKSRHMVRVTIRVPGSGGAVVQRLIAASARARSGVTLGGQRLGSNGAWQGRPDDETIALTRHGYVLLVPRWSAALVSVAPPTAVPSPVVAPGLQPQSSADEAVRDAPIRAPHAPPGRVPRATAELPRLRRSTAADRD